MPLRPLWLVGLLAFLSAPFAGGYMLLWLGLTWRDIKRATGDDSMHPVGHALSQYVPIYGQLRFLDHFQTIGTVAAASGSLVSIHAMLALVGVLLGQTLIRLSKGATGVAELVGMGLTAAAVVYGQVGMNAYARAIATAPLQVRAGWLEWALGPLLLAVWALVLWNDPLPGSWATAAWACAVLVFAVLGIVTRQRPPVTPDTAAQQRRPQPRLRAAVAALSAPTKAVAPTGYRLVLTGVPAPADPVVRLLRAFDETLQEDEAKAVVARLPAVIADDLPLDAAVGAQRQLLAIGATAELR